MIDAVIISVKNRNGRRITNNHCHPVLQYASATSACHSSIPPYPSRCIHPEPTEMLSVPKSAHGRSHCWGQQTCARCGETGHDDTDCQGTQHCVNCKSNHAASSKACPKWKLEQRMRQIRAETNISFTESRKVTDVRIPLAVQNSLWWSQQEHWQPAATVTPQSLGETGTRTSFLDEEQISYCHLSCCSVSIHRVS